MDRSAILLVDDSPSVIAALKRVFYAEDLDMHSAENGAMGLEILAQIPVKVVVSDEMMPGMTGTEFLKKVKVHYPFVIRMMLTGNASIEAAMRAVNEGEIYRFFSKPWDDVQLLLAVRSAVEKYDLEAENRLLLQTVKRQAVELKLIERQYPHITELKRDTDGTILIDELADEGLSDIIRQCDVMFAKPDPAS